MCPSHLTWDSISPCAIYRGLWFLSEATPPPYQVLFVAPPHTHTTVYLSLKAFSLTWLSLFSAAVDHFPCYQGVQMSSQCISERPWKPLPKSVGVHLWFGNILDHLFGAKDPKPKPLMFYLGSCKGWLHFLHTFVLLGQGSASQAQGDFYHYSE